MENYSALLTIVNNQETMENYPVTITKDDNEIKFFENNNKNILKINDNRIALLRESGNGTLKINFELEKMTDAIYIFDKGSLKFKVKTIEMISDESLILINYKLYDDKQLINSVLFKLIIKEE